VRHAKRKIEIFIAATANTNEFVEKVCMKWKATAGFAGMAAVYSTMAALNSGDHIVSSSSVFGATHPCSLIIFQSGIFKHRILILTSQKRSKVSSHRINSFAESPTNPAVDIIDLELLGKIAKSTFDFNRDNCFATPYLQQPIKWGAFSGAFC
jgi:O-succinylhomoserine sulfhydrylase